MNERSTQEDRKQKMDDSMKIDMERTKEQLNKIITEIQQLFIKDEFTKKDIVELLNKMIPNFQHIETGVNLDQKM